MKKTRQIKAVPNKSRRTFTIYSQWGGKTELKHRTQPFDKTTFLSMSDNTQWDWLCYLQNEDSYYVVQ